MDEDSLRQALDRFEASRDPAWVEQLDERKRAELSFHDRRRAPFPGPPGSEPRSENVKPVLDFYSAAAGSASYARDWIDRQAPATVFLDYACGEGFNAIRAARAGARLALGLDLSGASVARARQAAIDAGVGSRVRFVQADAEETGLPDGSIERAICNSAMHHLELSRAYSELLRILAPGGRVLVLEPLGYNPVIRLYRRLTPRRRTEWETDHPFTLKDVDGARRFLDVQDLRFWHIASLLGAVVRPLRPALDVVDAVLTRLPIVRLAAWIVSFELVKPGAGRGCAREMRGAA